tara:strand:+ start:612 stop:788 length:177 start_codon:yes stop_codon:yes gene_type:complete
MEHKPVIETMINTAALALTAFGVQQITQGINISQGYIALLFGVALEFIKYVGRGREFW